jgi:hypothetical protein
MSPDLVKAIETDDQQFDYNHAADMAGSMQAGVQGLKERLKKNKERLKKNVESKTVDDVSAEEADNDPEAEQQDEQETEESSEDEVPFGN